MLAIAPSAGVRLVALNRREYRHSTPYPRSEIEALANASEEELAKWYRLRGLEFATFMYKFVAENGCPAPNGATGAKGGGIGLMGWSLGGGFACMPIAYLDTYPPTIRDFFKRYFRAVIFQGSQQSC